MPAFPPNRLHGLSRRGRLPRTAAEDGDFYFVLYESKEQKGFYDLVLQNTDEEDATYGTKVESCTYGEYSFILSSNKLWYISSGMAAVQRRLM